MNAHHLRKQLRQQRLRLSKRHRNRAAYQARRGLNRLQHPALTGKNVKMGIFADAFGEMPTQPLMDWARQRGYRIYLPVVTGKHQPLVFIEFTQKTWRQSHLPKHPLGMRQPEKGKMLKASELNVLFMPLVAADKIGNRMGMGGGFYDTTLGKSYRTGASRPLKIGWCYDFQVVEQLARQPWDVPLDGLITPSGLRWF